MDAIIAYSPLLFGWILDLLFGDPINIPHPIVRFGKIISTCDRHLNKGQYRKLKGSVCVLILIIGTYALAHILIQSISNTFLNLAMQSILIFYCLAGTTLIKEVKGVFNALETGIQEGRRQVGRIVGRDTASLTADEVRLAAMETLAENLSDGVVAPLFWYALLGVPGMLAYKMVNTLDSMIGYRNERYKDFGCTAARIDDIANFLPARITSFLMIISYGKLNLYSFIKYHGNKHLSPNSGYPEAALAGILDCRFGGPHNYFGETVYKPYIGETVREITLTDMKIAVSINRRVECLMILLILIGKIFIYY